MRRRGFLLTASSSLASESSCRADFLKFQELFTFYLLLPFLPSLGTFANFQKSVNFKKKVEFVHLSVPGFLHPCQFFLVFFRFDRIEMEFPGRVLFCLCLCFCTPRKLVSGLEKFEDAVDPRLDCQLQTAMGKV